MVDQKTKGQDNIITNQIGNHHQSHIIKNTLNGNVQADGKIITAGGQVVNAELKGDVYAGGIMITAAGNVTITPSHSPTPPRLPPPPRLPKTFIYRSDEMEILTRLLLDKTEQHPIVMQGRGGFGKTTLAKTVCYNKAIQQVFPDGVLWVELGPSPNLLNLVMNQLKLIDPYCPNFTDLNAASAKLQQLLNHRSMLLVLDDVWHEAHAQPFLLDNPHYACLITTRCQNVGLRLRARVVDVNEMNLNEATDLLLKWLKDLPADHQPFYELAHHLGRWPLLLQLAASYLHELIEIDQLPLDKAIAELWKELSTIFERADGEFNQTMTVSLEASLNHLGKWRDRYLEMAIFPQETDIPIETLNRLWKQTAKLTAWEAKRACQAMQGLFLFHSYQPHNQTVRLHPIIHHYLVRQQAENLVDWHNQLISGLHLEDVSHLIKSLPNEPYFLDYLAYHLIQAKRGNEWVELVKDLRYLATKSYYRSVYAAEVDLLLAEKYLFDRKSGLPLNTNASVLALLRHHFANIGHLLNNCASLNEATVMLYSHLYHLPELTPLVRFLLADLPPPYLLPSQPLLSLLHPALIRTLTGHALPVTACAFSPDGQTILSASLDYSLKIWNSRSGQKRLTLKGHERMVSDCTFSPDGLYALSASWDWTLKIWNVRLGLELLTLIGHTNRVLSCAYSPDGRYILSASADHTLKIWQADNGHCLLTLNGHAGVVNDCAYNPDGRQVVSASADHTLKVWDAQTGDELFSLAGHMAAVTACAYSPDGGKIVSASKDHTLMIWQASNGRPLLTLSGHQATVTDCTYSPDGQFILSASHDRTLKLWDAYVGQQRFTLSGHTDKVSACAYSLDGQRLLSASADGTLKVWDANLETLKAKLLLSPCMAQTTAGKYAIHSCNYSPDGHTIVTASDDGLLKVWDAHSEQNLLTLNGHDRAVHSCVYSPDGAHILSASWDGTLKIWYSDNGQELLTLSEHTAAIEGCAYSPDGQRIISASEDGTLKVWDVASGQCLLTLSGHEAVVLGCSYSPDGERILSASGDHTLKVWDANSGQEIFTLHGHTAPVHRQAYSPDGQFIVSASDDHTLRVWQAHGGESLLTLSGHSHWVNGCAYSANGQYILSASLDNSLKLWNAMSGQCLITFAIDSPLYDCAFAPDGQHIVAVGKEGIYFLRLVEEYQ